MPDKRTDHPHSAHRGAMPRITVSVREACEQTGASKSFIHKMIKEGTIESSLVGDRRFISVSSLERVFKK